MDGTAVEDEEGGRAKTKAEKARERKARSRAKLKEQGNFEEAEKNRKEWQSSEKLKRLRRNQP